MEVRLAREDELDRVGSLTVEVYVDGGFITPGSDYVAVLADAHRRAREAELWVAVESRALLGAVAWCPGGSPFQELASDGEGEFRMLAVAPQARGRGVGAALVGKCLDRAGELGCSAVVLSTMTAMTAAQRLYERLGFVRVPEQDWSPVPGVLLLAFRREVSSAAP